MSKVLPVLDNTGWVSDPAATMSKLFAHAFVSDKSQSNTYAGTVISVANIVAEYGSDPVSFINAMRDELKSYYGRYFDNVIVEVFTTTPLTDTDTVVINYDVSITCYRDNIKYELVRVLEVDTSDSTTRFFNTLNT